MKVKCINAGGSGNGILTNSKIYDATEHNVYSASSMSKGYYITADNGVRTWFIDTRFQVVDVVKLKCIDAASFSGGPPAFSQYNGVKFDLAQDAFYEGIPLADGSGYELIIPSLSSTWRPYFHKRRFVVVDDTCPETLRQIEVVKKVDVVDEEEEKVWAFFMKPVADPHTCGRCGMPAPCDYHRGPVNKDFRMG